jgi:hypothetical protein
MSTDELPQVVGDLDPEREIIRLSNRDVAHLAERTESCGVVASTSRRRYAAAVEFDDRRICRDCARGERES